MKNTAKKHMTALLVAGLLLVAAPIVASATDAPVDEAEVYGEGAVTVASIENAPALYSDNQTRTYGTALQNTMDNNTTSYADSGTHMNGTNTTTTTNTTDGTTANGTTGTTTTNTDGMTIETDGTTNNTILVTTESPSTGVPSMMLPIGTALLSLATIPVVMRKKK